MHNVLLSGVIKVGENFLWLIIRISTLVLGPTRLPISFHPCLLDPCLYCLVNMTQ